MSLQEDKNCPRIEQEQLKSYIYSPVSSVLTNRNCSITKCFNLLVCFGWNVIKTYTKKNYSTVHSPFSQRKSPAATTPSCINLLERRKESLSNSFGYIRMLSVCFRHFREILIIIFSTLYKIFSENNLFSFTIHE